MNILQKSYAKFLGLIVNQVLTSKQHAELLAHKVAMNINVIRHAMKFINKKALLQLYSYSPLYCLL